MPVIVRIPTPLRSLTAGADEIAVEGAVLTKKTVGGLIDHLEQKHPGVKDRLLDDKGVRKFINVYLGEEDIRFLDGLDTAVKDGDELSIVPAIAGG